MAGPYMLTSSVPKDTSGIAACHLVCFKKSLASQLGKAYAKKTFDWFLISPNRFLFHISEGEKIIGYCGGFIPQYVGDGSTSGIMQYAMRQAVTGVILHPWLLFNKDVMAMYPLILKNIGKKFFKKKQQGEQAEPVKPFDKRVGLVVIGVHPQYRGTGAFQQLMQEFERRALQNNIHKLVLSVKRNNARAINAYVKQGWFIYLEHAQTLEMYKNI